MRTDPAIVPLVKFPRTALPAVVCLSLVAASCGSDSDGESSTGSTTGTEAPVSTEAPVETDAPADTTPATDAPTADAGLIDTPMSADDAAAVDAAAELATESLTEFGATAMYLGVWDPDKGFYTVAYGDASTGGPAATVADSFRIGSITKTVTATVILQLVDEGALTLDDTIGDLLPDLAAQYPDIAGLTVQQLLSMTSGIPDYLNVPDGATGAVVEDPARVWETEELIAIGVNEGLAEAGTPGYSTTNYLILQLIAEDLTGMPLSDAIAERITEPLGMETFVLPPNDDTTLPEPSSAGYVAGPCIDEFAAVGAVLDGPTETTDWNVSYGQGGGGITATIADLGIWAGSGVGNALLSDDTVTERNTFEPIEEGLDYGLGILENGAWVGHTGEVFGWEAGAFRNPDTGVTAAFAANGCGGTFLGFIFIMETLYPETGALTLIGL